MISQDEEALGDERVNQILPNAQTIFTELMFCGVAMRLGRVAILGGCFLLIAIGFESILFTSPYFLLGFLAAFLLCIGLMDLETTFAERFYRKVLFRHREEDDLETKVVATSFKSE